MKQFGYAQDDEGRCGRRAEDAQDAGHDAQTVGYAAGRMQNGTDRYPFRFSWERLFQACTCSRIIRKRIADQREEERDKCRQTENPHILEVLHLRKPGMEQQPLLPDPAQLHRICEDEPRHGDLIRDRSMGKSFDRSQKIERKLLDLPGGASSAGGRSAGRYPTDR